MRARTRAFTALIAVSLVATSSAASPSFFEDFNGPSWKSNFVKSTVDKYSGVLVTEVPEGLEDPALKARAPT